MSEPKYYDEKAKDRMMRYQKDKLERVAVWVPKGVGSEWKAHAELVGESYAAFFKRAVAETIARDPAKIREAMKNAQKDETE
jgi:hypothetical protein